MKKVNYIYVIVALIIVAFVAYFTLSSRKIDESKTPIKVGASLALTGSLSFLGDAERNGLLLGIEDINNRGGIDGRRLELIVEDNKGDATSAVSGTQKLLSSDRVDVYVTAFTHITQAVKGIVSQPGVPMLYISSLPDIARENKIFFRDYLDAEKLGKILANHIVKTDVKTVAYLGEQNDACFPYRDEIKKILGNAGIKVEIEEQFAGDSKDLRTQLLKIKTTNIGAIVTCSWRKSDILMPQLKQLEMIKTPVFSTVAPFLPNADTAEMRKLYEENGTVSTWYGLSMGSLNPAQQDFAKRYMERFGKAMTSDAAFAYDDAMIIAKAVEPCLDREGNLDNTCFSSEMLKTKYSGIAGEISFDKDGVSQRDGILIRVKNGQWVEVK